MSATLAAYMRSQLFDVELYNSLKAQKVLEWCRGAVWQWSDARGVWQPYDDLTNQVLEKGYMDNEVTLQCQIG